MTLNALGNFSGTTLILGGITLLFWQPDTFALAALPGSELNSVLIGMLLIVCGVLLVGAPHYPELKPSQDPQEHSARTGMANAEDRKAMCKEELAAWHSIWSDPKYIGALLADGVSRAAIAEVSENDLANPGADFVVSPGALFVADPRVFARLDEMSWQELRELGFYDERPPHGPAVVDLNLPVRKPPPHPLRRQGGDEASGTQKRECACRWVWTIGDSPHPELSDNWLELTSASGSGQWFNHGPVHGMFDSWTNNCPGGDGSITDKAGWMIITSKVVCDPKGCCKPKGKTLAVSDYRSKVGANSGSGFCFFLSTFGNAVGADAVQFYVDGKLVPGGSGAAMATSGASVIASLSAEIGAGASAGPDGTSLSGSGTIGMTATKTKAGGKVADALNKFGSRISDKPGAVSELQSGGKTLASVHRKASALGEQVTNVAGMGQIGVETGCGAGTFWAYRVINTKGPVGRAGKAAFITRFRLLRDQFLP